MTDYGHDLKFGTFITPQARQAEEVVALAELTESSGLDLATFQDHPYQANFLDTWTLLSFVAARTSRIALSGNVLNLPLRPPTVLARAAATLDLLSHGRFELGLGAGAFWASKSSEGFGMPIRPAACASRANITRRGERGGAHFRSIASASGWAPISPEC